MKNEGSAVFVLLCGGIRGIDRPAGFDIAKCSTVAITAGADSNRSGYLLICSRGHDLLDAYVTLPIGTTIGHKTGFDFILSYF